MCLAGSCVGERGGLWVNVGGSEYWVCVRGCRMCRCVDGCRGFRGIGVRRGVRVGVMWCVGLRGHEWVWEGVGCGSGRFHCSSSL